MRNSPFQRKVLLEFPRYNAGLTMDEVRRTSGVEHIVKLASNENPRGPSPRVAEALDECKGSLYRYPDPAALALRSMIADATGIPVPRITVANGSESLIESICLAVLEPGDRVVTLDPSFDLHVSYPRLMKAQVDRVAVSAEMEFDIDAMARAVSHPTRILMFSNPSNPVGCVMSRSGLERLLGSVSPHTLLVMDEAYIEYGMADGCVSALDVLAGYSGGWVVLRTFSKAYGLAGLRVGYALASDDCLVESIDKVKTPFNVNVVAQRAAVAALSDAQHVIDGIREIRQERVRMRRALERRGFRVAPSGTNFLFVDCGEDSAEFASRLLSQGVIVKPWRSSEYSRFVRMTVGAPDENDALLRAIDHWRCDA